MRARFGVPRGVRGWLSLTGILAIALALALPAGVAAVGGPNGAPGNNGTVKIHDGGIDGDQSGGANDIDNDPHVCTFHLHFFFADAGQSGSWWIQTWPPSGPHGPTVLSGTYLTGANGEYRTPASPGFYTLPDGHYKLFWQGRNDQNVKHKVFWVSCATASPSPSESTGGQTASPVPSESESAAPSESESAAPSESESAAPSESESAAPSESESAAPSESESAAPSESESPAPSESVGGETATPVASESAAPTESVGGVTSAPSSGSTPPPTSAGASSIDGGGNGVLRLVLFALGVFILALMALLPVIPATRRR